MTQLRRLAPVLLLLVVTGLAGCVSVPTVGPIETVAGKEPECQNCVGVEVAPPLPGDNPLEIVVGYLRATSNYQPDYATAKQFLTRSASAIWSPEVSVSIFRGAPVQEGNTVTLEGRLVGSLDSDRTYTPQSQALKVGFGLVQEDGQWRIDKPPPGLWVAEFSFVSFYRAYQLYFIGKYFVGEGGALVPDSIYLPSLGDPANVASALMKALLDGPSKWLTPAVTSAIPRDTTLSVESVTITDGIAEVRLSETLLALSDPQRSLLAAQIVYTLKQAGGVRGVLITVNGQPYRVPESDPNSLAVAVDAIPRTLEPVPFVTNDVLYAAKENQVGLVNDAAEPPKLTPLDGLPGDGQFAVDSLAVSVTGTDIAVVTDNRTALRRAATATTTGAPTPLEFKEEVNELLPPQFTRFGEIWAVGEVGGEQKMWLFTSDKAVEVDAPVLDEGKITAFSISPDGARMAMVRTVPGGSALGLARIVRTSNVSVGDWREITSAQTENTQVSQIADIAWIDATELILLGTPTVNDNLELIRIRDDGSRITSTTGEPSDWDARDITVQMRTKTTIVRGLRGDTWRNNGSQWVLFLDNINAIAYPG